MENISQPNAKDFFNKRLRALNINNNIDGNAGVREMGGGMSSNLRHSLTGPIVRAGVQHRRIIKKHIQQKYLLCGFAIHAFLCTPAYLYGNVVESDKDLVMRIWPAIVYQATGELCRSILEHLDTEYRGCNKDTIKYRRTFLLATITTCCSLMISGIFFSSAWIQVTNATQIIAIVFYGFFGGIGASLFIWKTHVILEAVRPREDKFVRKTIHLCGEAFCQLCLSFAFTNLRTLYGTAQSIVLMSALLVNLIPISLIITRHREDVLTPSSITILKSNEVTTYDSHHQQHHYHKLGRYTNNLTDQLDGIEMKTWKNPSSSNNISNSNNCNNTNFNNAVVTVKASAAVTVTPPPTPTAGIPKSDNHNFLLPTDNMNVTFLNPNGVEIMEIIPEEDENLSVRRSSSVTINNCEMRSLDNSQIIYKSLTNDFKQCHDDQANTDHSGNLNKRQRFPRNIVIQLWWNIYETILQPLSVAICIPQLYTTTLLSSTDIFSYIMCLTVLPGIAVSQHAIKNAEIPFLFSLLAFPWMCFALMTPRFGNSLYKHKMQWHSLGCTCKVLALTFISFSNSKLLLSVSAVLLGFGQAVTLFLQEWVFQLSMTYAHWMAIRFPVHLTNTILILGWGVLAHWMVVQYTFQTSVGLAAVLYACSTLLWYIIFMFIHII